jgi:hypothetical protein
MPTCALVPRAACAAPGAAAAASAASAIVRTGHQQENHGQEKEKKGKPPSKLVDPEPHVIISCRVYEQYGRTWLMDCSSSKRPATVAM